jgi:flagellar biosynthetic protein FlhB
MADKSQKTEKPTERRKKKARSEGQVVRSQDLVPWLMVLIATFVLPAYVSAAGNTLSARIGGIRGVAASPTRGAAAAQVSGAVGDILTLTVPVLLGAVVIAVAMSLAQTGFVLSPKALKPQPKRLNPIAGLKRLVSPRGQWEAAKAALRLAAVALVAVPLVLGVARDLSGRGQFDLEGGMAYLGGRLLALARIVALLGLLISAADFAMQRRNQMRDLKMSKQEIKDEQKQADGDPQVKSRMRRAAQQISRNRMLAGAGDASVIVVNPTHYSVALRYDEQMGVPIVIAKGVGQSALRMRAEGLAKSIPVVECRPLARALYRVCAVGTPVPRDLFQGVAVLLAFVHRLGRRRSLGGIHQMPYDLDMLEIPEQVMDRAGTGH